MNVIVINKKESVICQGKIRKYGEEFEVDNIIAQSLIERGYVKEFTKIDEEDEAEVMTGYLDTVQLNELSYPELKKLAADMGLDTKGKKEEIIARITAEAVEAVPAEEEAIAEEESSGDLPNTAMPD